MALYIMNTTGIFERVRMADQVRKHHNPQKLVIFDHHERLYARSALSELAVY
jgi:hypothetical protein